MKISAVLLCVCVFIEVRCRNVAVIDLSDECENNLKANFFLTYGMGFADGLALVFTNFFKNCTINLYTSRHENSTAQIVILEAIAGMQWDNFCRDNKITISDEFEVVKLCPELKQTADNIIYVGLFKYHRTTVKLRTNSSVGLKITATSARLLKDNEECIPNMEIPCTVTNRPVCVNIDLQCDQNINCGKYELFDEETGKCKSELYDRHLAVIIPALVFATLTCLVILKLCYVLAPKLPDHFFTSANAEDNKLIVSTRVEHGTTKTDTSDGSTAKTQTKIKQTDDRNASNAVSGDSVAEAEMELRSHYYTSGKHYRPKRLTTNSPVYRNTRVATVLLESIRNLEDYEPNVTDTDSSSPHFPGSSHGRQLEQAVRYSKRRRFSTPDLI